MSYEGTLPILREGETIGSLSIRQEGLYTVFSGTSRDPGGLLRLSVYGNGEGYLGVMTPQKGGLAIEKRLSRSAMAAFPDNPQYAGPSGLGNLAADPSPATAEENTQARPEENLAEAGETLEAEKEPEVEASSEEKKEPDAGQDEEDEHDSGAEPITYWRVLPNPWSMLGGMANKSALTAVRGALTTVEDERRLIALLPEEVLKLGDIGVNAPAPRRIIDGTDYVIFEIKNGKLF